MTNDTHYSEIRRFTPSEVKTEFEKVQAGRSGSKGDPSLVTAKLTDLMTRTDYPDKSQHAMSLLTALAYENCDPSFIDAGFRKSSLFLETHWGQKFDRPDLHDSQIAKAIAWVKEHPRRNTDRTTDEQRKLIVESAHGIIRRPPCYLWPKRLQLGTINHVGGQQSEGKTPLHVDLYARITSGREWPDGQSNTWGPRAVLVLSDEDDWESVWLPRFDLAGGNDHHLFRVRGVEITRLSKDGETLGVRNGLTALSQDLHLLTEEAQKIPNLVAILIDPISAYLGRKISMNNEQEVREVLTPLSLFASERSLVVNTIGHLNKSESQDPLMRMMGAAAFTGVARVVYSVGPDKQATGNDAKYRHVMARVRGVVNDKSLRYHTELIEREIEPGVKSDVVHVVWDGESEQTASDNVTPVSQREQRDIVKAAKLLRDYLIGGRRKIRECTEFMKSNGFDLDKLNAHRVKEVAKVSHKKDGKEWYWGLATSDNMFEPTSERENRLEEIKRDDAPEF
jgi:hypothetical protein